VTDAGAEWPSQVKAVTFIERARPTLLRAGPLGNQDAPTRGTVWIEEGTGRVLQTELQVGSGRSTIKALTTFTLEDRLQIMVPDTMRTENPSGTAAYSNFERSTVDTQFAVRIRNEAPRTYRAVERLLALTASSRFPAIHWSAALECGRISSVSCSSRRSRRRPATRRRTRSGPPRPFSRALT
jgi:hypothetical protein